MKKRNCLFIVIIIVLFLLNVGLVGFIIYDKVIIQKNNPDVDKISEKEDKLTEQEKLNISINFNDFFDKYYLSIIDSYEDKISDFNLLKNQDKLLLIRNYFDLFTNNNRVYSSEINPNYFNKVFNKNIDIIPEDSSCCKSGQESHCHIKYYNDGDYYANNPLVGGHGSSISYNFYKKLIDFEEVDGKYILTYIKAFGYYSDGGPSFSYYFNYNHTVPEEPFLTIDRDEFFSNIQGDEISTIEKYISEKVNSLTSYDNIPKYKYTFELREDGTMFLTSYEYVK